MFKKLQYAVVPALALAASSAAFADTSTVPDGTATLTGLVASQASYAPVMYLLAAGAVATMIAVKWIKRGRGAA